MILVPQNEIDVNSEGKIVLNLASTALNEDWIRARRKSKKERAKLDKIQMMKVVDETDEES